MKPTGSENVLFCELFFSSTMAGRQMQRI